MSDEAENQQESLPKKKGFLGVTMHMTGGRWLMVGTGGLMFLTAMGAMWLEGRNANVDAGANVGVQASNGMRNAPGKSSPEYAAQVRAYNKKMAAEALAHGQSFVGIPVTSVTNENMNPPPLTQTAPVNENPQPSASQQQPPQMQQPQADGSISKEIGVIATSMENERRINPGYYIPHYRMPRSTTGGLENVASTSAASAKSDLPVIRPGTIIYGVFENAMKSSMPGR